jgi:acetoin utilization deacetylase AcuC-like enzyme
MFLEGGYDLAALRTSVASTLAAVLQHSYENEAQSSGGPGTEMVQNAQAERLVALRIAREAASKEDYPS